MENGHDDMLEKWPVVLRSLPLAQLFVDPSYQRKQIPAWIRHIAANFDPELFERLKVSDRGNTTYAVMDGQQRMEAVRTRNPEEQLVPCLVYSGLSRKQEAKVFAKTQAKTGRKLPSVRDTFRADLFGGDAGAVSIEQTVVAAGFTVSLNGSNSEGAINAIGALIYIQDEGRGDDLALTLELLRDGWGVAGAVASGVILKGIYRFAAHFRGHYERDRVVQVFQGTSPSALLVEGTAQLAVFGGNKDVGVARAITHRYNKRLAPNRRLEW
jgi:hypothetical protein